MIADCSSDSKMPIRRETTALSQSSIVEKVGNSFSSIVIDNGLSNVIILHLMYCIKYLKLLHLNIKRQCKKKKVLKN